MKDNTPQIKGKDLLVENRAIWSSQFPIAQIIAFDESIVVRVEAPLGTKSQNENVFGISWDGEELWQVPHDTYVYEDSPFTNLSYEAGMVKLTNWDGTNLLLDPTSGKIISKNFSK